MRRRVVGAGMIAFVFALICIAVPALAADPADQGQDEKTTSFEDDQTRALWDIRHRLQQRRQGAATDASPSPRQALRTVLGGPYSERVVRADETAPRPTSLWERLADRLSRDNRPRVTIQPRTGGTDPSDPVHSGDGYRSGKDDEDDDEEDEEDEEEEDEEDEDDEDDISPSVAY